MGDIIVGSSGWSYRDWIGTFYPRGSRTDHLLREYFQHFRTVEINTTFYQLPPETMVSKWIDQAPENREFCVKVPREISHEFAMREDEGDMREAYAGFASRVLEPLEDAALLGAVLFQASPYFAVRGDIKYKMKSEPKVPLPKYVMGVERLKDILKTMAEHSGERALELRNSSWLDEESRLIDKAGEVLRNSGTALVTVDGPSFPWVDVETSRHNYVRFHGRNREGWFRSDEGDPSVRYRYLYEAKELKEKVDPIKIMASKVDRSTRIFFNNHPEGYAPKNARTMQKLLGIESPVMSIDSSW